MKICHVCKAECEDAAELCPVCGADLTDEKEEKTFREVILKNPVLVASVEDVVSAEIFKDILNDNGILFTCEEPYNDGTMKVLFGGSFVADDIYVEDSDFEKASLLYEDFLNSEPQFENDFNEQDIDENDDLSVEDN